MSFAALNTTMTAKKVKWSYEPCTGSQPRTPTVKNTILRYLNNDLITQVADLYIKQWALATLPSSWKHSDITLIPKSGKPSSRHEIHPTFLSSCIGKLLEHVFYNRMSHYLEYYNQYPPNMIGYNAARSTQNALFQFHHDLRQHPPAKDNFAIASLDLHTALDDILWQAILTAISNLALRT
ncbi:hypothetical protein HPB48_013251 [Haemaphysalis longicornis]|uniref:Reverse transcriptase n=1 Tax=Haemaphysalis longicornis TaxID=44386 RepID=A0A9J6GPW1_HAELO|nr:hypothetical protein HPB48_013251 [Haemaphysalis longicornis]